MIETTLVLLIVVLAILNIAQFFFWSRQIHKLVDKLMSRNYAEYVQIASSLPSKPKEKHFPSDEDDQELDTLNHLLAGS